VIDKQVVASFVHPPHGEQERKTSVEDPLLLISTHPFAPPTTTVVPAHQQQQETREASPIYHQVHQKHARCTNHGCYCKIIISSCSSDVVTKEGSTSSSSSSWTTEQQQVIVVIILSHCIYTKATTKTTLFKNQKRCHVGTRITFGAGRSNCQIHHE